MPNAACVHDTRRYCYSGNMVLECDDLMHHLGYEWWMFRSTLAALKRLNSDQLDGRDDPVRNALVESMVLHGRALIDFFFKRGGTSHKSDWTVESFELPDLKRKKVTEKSFEASWHAMASKRVMHMATERSEPAGSWDGDKLYELLDAEITSLFAHLPGSRNDDWLGNASTESLLLARAFSKGRSREGPVTPTGPASPTGPLGPTGPRGPAGTL